MAGDKGAGASEGLDGSGLRIGVVRARWNSAIVDRLAQGVGRGLAGLGVDPADVIDETVPGSFELPMGARILAASGRVDAVICLGCVIRGETSHYDIVCNNANHWLMHVAVANAVPLGNAILTVDTEAQALERARGGRKGKGADAVRACLAVVAIDRAFADEEVP